MATFPNAQHVRFFLHFKGNIEQKLWELNVSSSVKDIMGNPSQLQRGLVDAESTEKLEERLTSFSMSLRSLIILHHYSMLHF